MIYFDNAATSGFKPNSCINSTINAIKYLNANAGRGSHKLAVLSEEFIFRARLKLSKTFNNERIERVIFTKNCTEALNMAIFSLAKPNTEVVTTVTEHNSVLRPLYAMQKKFGVKIKIATPKVDDVICENDILPLVTKDTSLVVINAVSNVTGRKNEYETLAKKIGCPLLIDCAQAVGHIEINLKEIGASCIAVAGHKGLYSIQGVGSLIFDERTEIAPLLYGGSGSDSFLPEPKYYPEKLEAGTLNLPAICSLFDGTDYAYSKIPQSQKRLTTNTKYVIDFLTKINASVYSKPNPFGIVSFGLNGKSSFAVSDVLSSKYDIATRGGFHCAPLIHKFLKTDEDGLVRISLASENTENEIEKLFIALNDINNAL